jgi:mannose-6-phosphate isomerase-like protein (cupin superfamily)
MDSIIVVVSLCDTPLEKTVANGASKAAFACPPLGTVAKETWASVARRIAASLETMTVQNLSAQPPFITKDSSTIRSILDRTNAPVQNQSLAEARVPAGGRTERHYHKIAEEFYFILEGAGEIELDGHYRTVRPADAILIPSGAWKQKSSCLGRGIGLIRRRGS